MILLFAALQGCPSPGDDVRPPSDTGEGTAPDGADAPLRINEVMSDNEDTLEDASGSAPDWIELYNPGPGSVDLDGWTLATGDDSGTLPSWTLGAGGFVVVFADGDDSTETELHLPFALSDQGETISLRDPDDTLVDTLVVPALPEDTSWGPEQLVEETTLVGEGTVATGGLPIEGWTHADFDDGAWASVVLGIGFDGEVASGDPTNVALGKSTSQSSDGYGYTGVQAVDGEPSTFSHTGDGDLTPWVEVDLEGSWSIDEVSLYNRVDCCASRLYNIVVEVFDSTGGLVWASEVQNPVSEGGTPADPGRVLLVTPDSPVVGASVRVSKTAVNGRGSSEWLSIGELEVRGVAASPYTGAFTTDVADLMGEATALGVRVPISVGLAPDRVALSLRYDDGVRVFVDGLEVLSANAGESAALTTHEGTTSESFSLAPAAFGLGDHLVAFEVQNVSPADDDLLLTPTLTVQTIQSGDVALFTVPTPGQPNGRGAAGLLDPPTFSPERGFAEASFTLSLTSASAGADLVYTTDGSTPSAGNGTRVVAVDDADYATAEVSVVTTAAVRAIALREAWASSTVATHSYLFLGDVVRQSTSPPGVPTTWVSQYEGTVAADYAMDPRVALDPTVADALLAGLRELPSLSIVLGPDDLWSQADGLYANSAGRGDEWEKSASIELILPDGSTGFAVDCGLRIHGYGWRYNTTTPKHSFRLEFSDIYGASKLHYPLFPDAAIDDFDSIVLRAGGSKTWLDFRDPAQAQYLHDAFARDTARDMGKADGHAAFVHLYLNGLYWGLYNAVERPEADFGAAYFGGEDEEYDAINRRTTTNEAIDGTLDAFLELLARADDDLSTDAGLAAVEEMLDLDDLIDYMLIHQYTVNRDGPCCFESNNMRAVRRRLDGEVFRFFVWDMEYSLWDEADATNVEVDVAGSASHIYARLRSNTDFRQRYADRALMHLTDGGALTPEAATSRYEARADEVFGALLAESARWGDVRRSDPYTRDVEWQIEHDRLVDEYFPARTAILISQLEAAGLY